MMTVQLCNRETSDRIRACGVGVNCRWGTISFFYFREGDPPPHFNQDAERDAYINKPKGMMQVLYERGWFVHGMTANGERQAFVPENPDAWQRNDLVIRNEENDTGDTTRYLYRVRLVPADHTDVGSDDDIECEWMTKRQWKGKEVYAPSGKTWIFASKSLSNVSRDAYIIESGKMKNKKMLRISIDVEAY